MDKFVRLLNNAGVRIIALCTCLAVGSLLPETAQANHPPLVLTCPDDIIINPEPGQCIAYVEFDSLNWFIDVPFSSAVFQPGPGTPFEYGNTMVELTVTDTNGNEQICSFMVTVEPNTYTLICDDLVPVYLLADCQREITPFMILEGGPYDCEDEYTVEILDNSGGYLGNVVDTGYIGVPWTLKVESNYSGNFCWGTILVLPDSIDLNIVCPPNATILCHESYEPDDVGYAAVQTCLEPEDYNVTYTELRLNSYCNGDEVAFVVERQWKVANIYGRTSTCQQTITAMRVGIEDIVFPPSYNNIAHPALACSDSLPIEMLIDTSQTGVPLINGTYPGGVACSMVFFVSDSIQFGCGESYVVLREWTAFDICTDETRTHIQTILVEDEEGPQFEVAPLLYASNQSDCGQLINLPPIQLQHECSSFDVEIRTPWDTLSSNGGQLFVPVSVGAYPLVYAATDVCDNVELDTTLLIFNSNVIASCPPDDTVTCSFYQVELQTSLNVGDLSVLQQFGNPELNANCSALIINESAGVYLDSCNQGSIIRTMSVEANGQEHSCQQTIEVLKVSDFIIEFPADITVFCTTGEPDFGEPEILGMDCEDIQVTYTDELYTVVPDACYKIVRTWVVSNGCVAGALLDDEVIEKPENELGLPFPLCDLDGDGDCDHRTFRDSWNDVLKPGSADALEATGFDTDPDSDPWDGYIVYEQTIKVSDNVDPVFTSCDLPVICTNDSSCAAGILLPIPPIEDCSDSLNVTAQIRINGVWAVGFGPHQNLLPGTYEVRYVARDLCNNQSDCETVLIVEDCSPPDAVCQNGLIIQLEPNNQPTPLWASDIDGGSHDNCPGAVDFSFSSNVNDTIRFYDCDSVGLRMVELYVTDDLGYQSSCIAQLEIQGGLDCEPSGMIPFNGTIATPEDVGISNVTVSTTLGTVFTNSDGFYNGSFQDVPFTVTPSRNFDPTNGVTTFDIVVLTRHILGEQPLDSPYKLIAADVNKTGTVTTFDAVGIRQLVLNIVSAFPNNSSWRFVPKDYVFPDPANPFASPFPESTTVNNASMATGLDFVGIKIGDLNASAAPFGNEPQERSENGGLTLQANDYHYQAGEVFSVPIYQEAKSVLGWQFALTFDPSEVALQEIKPGFVSMEHFGRTSANTGIIPTSWNSANSASQSGGHAFTLVFKAHRTGQVGDWLRLGNDLMIAEAYSQNLERMGIRLELQAENSTGQSTICYPARPNPFTETVELPYYMPESGRVTFTLCDISGVALLGSSTFVRQGYHSLRINAFELPGPGLYIYRLETDWGGGQGKIILK